MSANTSTTEPESNHLHFPLITANESVKVAIREGLFQQVGAKGPQSLKPLQELSSKKPYGIDVPGEKSPAS